MNMMYKKTGSDFPEILKKTGAQRYYFSNLMRHNLTGVLKYLQDPVNKEETEPEDLSTLTGTTLSVEHQRSGSITSFFFEQA